MNDGTRALRASPLLAAALHVKSLITTDYLT